MKAFPAFPTESVTLEGGQVVYGYMGMDLRDYFAAKALQGMFANPNDGHQSRFETYEEYVADIAHCAYEMADAMMKARIIE